MSAAFQDFISTANELSREMEMLYAAMPPVGSEVSDTDIHHYRAEVEQTAQLFQPFFDTYARLTGRPAEQDSLRKAHARLLIATARINTRVLSYVTRID